LGDLVAVAERALKALGQISHRFLIQANSALGIAPKDSPRLQSFVSVACTLRSFRRSVGRGPLRTLPANAGTRARLVGAPNYAPSLRSVAGLLLALALQSASEDPSLLPCPNSGKRVRVSNGFA
jgi:hypothetical protein